MGAASLGDPQSLNLYAYCGNDPINHTDPDGLFFKKLFSAFGKALRFLFKVIAVELAIAVLAAGSPGGVLILLGLATVFGIAGWHNGKLGNFVRTLLLAGGANSKHGGFKTPSTFGNGSSNGVNGFLAKQRKQRVSQGGQFTLSQSLYLLLIRTLAAHAILKPGSDCAQLLGGRANALKVLRRSKALNAHTINPAFKGTRGIYTDDRLSPNGPAMTVAAVARAKAEDPNDTSIARSEIGGSIIYFNKRFFSQRFFDQVSQDIHELKHLNGATPQQIDRDYKQDYQEIADKCGTSNPIRQ
jgi:hypothetical protein